MPNLPARNCADGGQMRVASAPPIRRGWMTPGQRRCLVCTWDGFWGWFWYHQDFYRFKIKMWSGRCAWHYIFPAFLDHRNVIKPTFTMTNILNFSQNFDFLRSKISPENFRFFFKSVKSQSPLGFESLPDQIFFESVKIQHQPQNPSHVLALFSNVMFRSVWPVCHSIVGHSQSTRVQSSTKNHEATYLCCRDLLGQPEQQLSFEHVLALFSNVM